MNALRRARRALDRAGLVGRQRPPVERALGGRLLRRRWRVAGAVRPFRIRSSKRPRSRSLPDSRCRTDRRARWSCWIFVALWTVKVGHPNETAPPTGLTGVGALTVMIGAGFGVGSGVGVGAGVGVTGGRCRHGSHGRCIKRHMKAKQAGSHQFTSQHRLYRLLIGRSTDRAQPKMALCQSGNSIPSRSTSAPRFRRCCCSRG